jgi:hypothetical protein
LKHPFGPVNGLITYELVDERTSGIFAFKVIQGVTQPSIVVSLEQLNANPVCALTLEVNAIKNKIVIS